MPTQMAPTVGGRHEYVLKTPWPVSRRVKKVAEKYNISYNAALNILLCEALDARNVEDS